MEPEDELPEDVTFVEALELLVKEECSVGNDVKFSLTNEGFQRVEIFDETDKEIPWFTVTLSVQPQEGKEDDFEGLAEVALGIFIQFIENEIGRKIDEQAALN